MIEKERKRIGKNRIIKWESPNDCELPFTQIKRGTTDYPGLS